MEKMSFTTLDGGALEERIDETKEFFGLYSEQIFEDLEVGNNITVETDLTDEEKDVIKRGRKEYEKENFVSLDSLN